MCAATTQADCLRVAGNVPRDRVELILGRLDQLASPSAVATQLLALTTSDDSSFREVIKIVESDAALTASILRTSRRADLGIRGDVLTVERAVALLGFNTLRNIVLSAHFFTAMAPDETDAARNAARRDLWLHSLAVACAAEMLAERTASIHAKGGAFVCGLLHDIGKIALETCLPKSYARVIDTALRRRRCVCDVEKELLGLDHTIAGRRLATRWRLPSPVVEAVWLHHNDPGDLPSTTEHTELLRLIYLADNLIRRQRIGFSGYGHIADLAAIGSPLGIDAAVIDDVAEKLPARMDPYCELVGLDRGTGESLYAESIVKANHELATLNTTLGARNRQLERSAHCLSAMRSLMESGCESTGTTDACVAAASAVSALFDEDRAAVFVLSAHSHCMHVGFAQGGAHPSTDIIELDAAQHATLLEWLNHTAEGEISAAPAELDAVWSRYITAMDDPRWLMAFGGDGRVCGGAMLTAPQTKAAAWQNAPDECRSLVAAIRLALDSAGATERAERTTEELLDINRRLKTAQHELVRARSISMVGEMAAGAAHELNNPLSVISGRAQLALQDCDNEQISRWLKLIIEQSHTASRIVAELMNFAKPSAPQPCECDLRSVLESLCQRWNQASHVRTDQINLTVADDACPVYADRVQLDAILDAVLANAIEACAPESAQIQINSPSRESDETVRIVIEDNGAGMTQDVLEHAVDPFFSSRPAGRGRGLGLSRAVRYAEINGGFLWLESTPNVGTVVSIELPARPPLN